MSLMPLELRFGGSDLFSCRLVFVLDALRLSPGFHGRLSTIASLIGCNPAAAIFAGLLDSKAPPLANVRWADARTIVPAHAAMMAIRIFMASPAGNRAMG